MILCLTTKLYRLICELGIRGLLDKGTCGGVWVPLLPFMPGKWPFDFDVCEEDDNVVGGDCLSPPNTELSVEEDLLLMRGSALPSLLELFSEDVVLA